MAAKCPPKQELVDYLLGKLPDATLASLESHFVDCGSCEETIRNLNAQDTFSDFVETAVELDEDPGVNDQQFLSTLITELQSPSRWNARSQAERYERAAEVLAALQPSEDPTQIGRIGGYQVLDIVGSGGTGVVFRAIDEKLSREVALKVLRPSLGKQARNRFIAEAKAAASIQHPNVVTIYHVCEENGLALIAMQWVPGQTLEERLHEVTFLPEENVRKIASQITAGLQAAHEKGLIHRDIKPANIWLREDNQEVIILDFGLARVADDDPHMTNTGVLAGTPNYMSPEQSRGQELDGRSDLFGLGCVMYRASTGKLPFGAGGVLATLQSIQNHHPAPPRQLNPNIGNDFSDLTMCLLEKETANRPESAEQLQQAWQKPRSQWPFVVAAASAGSSETIAKPQVKTQTRSGWLKWLSLAAMICLGIFGWQTFGQQIVRITTNQGELVIETSDDDVEVKILSGEDVVRVIDTQSLQRVDIKAGEYELRASGKTGDHSFQVQPNTIVMTRGGKTTATITRVGIAGAATSRPKAPTLANAGVPVFKGRSFSQWEKTLENEKSEQGIFEALNALGVLAVDSKEMQLQALESFKPHLRIWGTNIITGDDDKVAKLNKALSHFPPERLVDLVVTEIPEGTLASRKSLIWCVAMGSIYQWPSKYSQTQQGVLRDNFQKICQTCFDYLDNDNPSADKTAVAKLVETLMGTCAEKVSDPKRPNETTFILSPDQREFLSNTFNGSDNFDTRFAIAQGLLGCDAAGEEHFEVLGQSLLTRPKSGSERSRFFDKLVSQKHHLATLVNPLIQLFEGDSRTKGFVKLRLQTSIGSFFPTNAVLTSLEFRKKILETFGNWGTQAKSALPWLARVGDKYPDLKADAERAIARIKGEPVPAETSDPAVTSDDGLSTGEAISEAIRNSLGGEKAAKTPTELPAASAVYEGKTAQWWLGQLDTERSRGGVREALVAIAALMPDMDDTAISKRLLPTLSLTMRRVFRGGPIDSTRGHYHYKGSIFNPILQQIPTKRLIEFAIHELESGNTNSRLHCEQIFRVEFYSKPELREMQAKELWKTYPRVFDYCFDAASSQPSKHLKIIFSGTLAALTHEYKQRGAVDQQLWHEHPELFDYFMKKLESPTLRNQSDFLRYIVGQENTAENYSRLIRMISDEKTPDELGGSLIRELLQSNLGKHFKLLIPTLIEIYNDERQLTRFSDYLNVGNLSIDDVIAMSRQIGGMSGGGAGLGFGGASDGASARGAAVEKQTDKTAAARARIICSIRDSGAFASDALPWLDEIADESDLGKLATEAAKEIRLQQKQQQESLKN